MKRSILAAIAAILISATMMAQSQTVRCFAHRAGRAENEENVLPSFQKCWNNGYTGFETDVHITKDGKFVIAHDSSMKRVFGKEGVIEDMTLKELMEYTTPQGNHILLLDDLLAFFKDKKGLYVEFEMKTNPELYPTGKLEHYCDSLYKVIMKAKPADATYLMTSFDYRAIRYLSAKHPGEDFLMLIHGDPISDKTIALAMALGVHRLAGTLNGTSRRMVKEAHEKGLIVSLYPGTGVEDFTLGCYVGADYLCTDYPQAVMDYVKTKATWLNVKF